MCVTYTCVFNMIKGGHLYLNSPERICGKPATKEWKSKNTTDWFCDFHYGTVEDWAQESLRKKAK